MADEGEGGCGCGWDAGDWSGERAEEGEGGEDGRRQRGRVELGVKGFAEHGGTTQRGAKRAQREGEEGHGEAGAGEAPAEGEVSDGGEVGLVVRAAEGKGKEDGDVTVALVTVPCAEAMSVVANREVGEFDGRGPLVSASDQGGNRIRIRCANAARSLASGAREFGAIGRRHLSAEQCTGRTSVIRL